MTEVRSYYGRPMIKEPVWTFEIPTYFYTGGLAGGSAVVGTAARMRGEERLARVALFTGAAADVVSAALLTSDLGRPARFLNMLRVFKVTSPMSVGSWTLTLSGASSGAAVALELLDRLPRAKIALEGVSAMLGPPLTVYTAVLVSDTAIPVWHDARRWLPFLFGASALASAGAALVALAPPEEAGSARRLAVGGVVAENVLMELMEKRLGFVGEVYGQGAADRLKRAAQALTVGGAALVGLAGPRRAMAAAGGAIVSAGELCLRWSVFKAGFQSARDPKYTVAPQRARSARSPRAPAHG